MRLFYFMQTVRRYRKLHSMTDLLTTLLFFELVLSIILYFVIPLFVAQYSGIGINYSAPANIKIGSVTALPGLPVNAYLSAIPIYIGVAMIILSLLTLIASFFSLRSKIILLSLFGFLAIILSGYSWLQSFSLTEGVMYPLLMLFGLVTAIALYSAQMRATAKA